MSDVSDPRMNETALQSKVARIGSHLRSVRHRTKELLLGCVSPFKIPPSSFRMIHSLFFSLLARQQYELL